MTKKEAIAITGGLSSESKMPGPAWGIPASACHRGSRLAKQEGTICSNCYANKNFYVMANVRPAFERRLRAITHPAWELAMTTLIRGNEYFRWFGSGDIQGFRHLHRIFNVCEATPATRHWLPTRELRYVREVMSRRPRPENLTIRISGDRVNEMPEPNDLGLPVAGVSDTKYDCPALHQGNSCGRCRRCWDPTENIIYHAH